ncbi:hypothetical protein ACFSQP_04100 [Bizionia sediminis]|uniref:T9SS C-terminal target domain-containing protein n=1 Tax=Bizionia sediminis TaxID=1737064 RepID=A0ABW5KPQ1_9FLAO
MKNLTYLFTWFACAFLLGTSPIAANTASYPQTLNDNPQLVRINFTMPNGYVRHLLLGFTPDNAATDGIDYGYDAENIENFPDDLNWIIENRRFIIQGVGAFDATKQYPFGMFISNNGAVEISLDKLENFETPIDVYLFDAENDSYTHLNEVSYQQVVTEGTYHNRFYLAFMDGSVASTTSDNELHVAAFNEHKTNIAYLQRTKELACQSNQLIKQIDVYNIVGKRIASFPRIYKKSVKLPLNIANERYGIVQISTEKGITSKKVLF